MPVAECEGQPNVNPGSQHEVNHVVPDGVHSELVRDNQISIRPRILQLLSTFCSYHIFELLAYLVKSTASYQ